MAFSLGPPKRNTMDHDHELANDFPRIVLLLPTGNIWKPLIALRSYPSNTRDNNTYFPNSKIDLTIVTIQWNP